MKSFKDVLNEAKKLYDIETLSDSITLTKEGEDIYVLERSKIHVGKMAGGFKVKWFIYNYAKRKRVGNTLTGYTKAEGLSQMKRFANTAISKGRI